MICYNCGTKLQDGETTCPACGKKQEIPESLLQGGKKGDRSSIIGLYNYSYASVYETVETYLSDEDEIQEMIGDIYVEAFRRIHEVPNAGEFRSFLSRIAKENLANRTPLEKEPAPGWLIIPETQTLRRILSGVADYMKEQSHLTAERELMKKYHTEAGQDQPDEQQEQSDDSWWKEASMDTSATDRESSPADAVSDFGEGSMEDELRQIASSANQDWGSIGFDRTLLENEPEEPVRDSRVPLILGIVLAVAAVVIVVILLIGAFGKNTETDSENPNVTTSESQSRTDSESELLGNDTETETESEVAAVPEDVTEAVTETEDVTETEATETEVDPSGNILMSDDVSLDEADAAVFGNEDVMRSEVGTVTFLDTLTDAPEDAWDVSANGDGLVMAWAIYDESTDLYDLYVAGEGGIYANEDSAYLFASYVSATSIAFHGCFYTQDATDMSGMFYECASLESLDLSDFDTSAVTNMSYMFYDCISLEEVDVSSFDTSGVTAMSYMFTACEALTELNLDGFDFANVTDMEYMLAGCSSLASLEIDTTDASTGANTEGMYEGTSYE